MYISRLITCKIFLICNHFPLNGASLHKVFTIFKEEESMLGASLGIDLLSSDAAYSTDIGNVIDSACGSPAGNPLIHLSTTFCLPHPGPDCQTDPELSNLYHIKVQNTPLISWLIWSQCQRAYAIMNCPSYVIVVIMHLLWTLLLLVFRLKMKIPYLIKGLNFMIAKSVKTAVFIENCGFR